MPESESSLSLYVIEKMENGIPQPVKQLLEEFEHLFQKPQGLPPHRAFDHSIPLLLGVKLVNLRPYQYNLA